MLAPNDSLHWFVIHTHPKQETRAERNLQAWNIETFCPKLKQRQRHPFTDEPIYVIKPLFPLYIFARFNAGVSLYKMSLTRGVNSVVSFGDSPTPVTDDIIAAIRERVMSDGLIHPGKSLRIGDKIEIDNGPLNSIVGVLEQELNDSERVMVLLSAINYQCRVLVSRDQIRRFGEMRS